MSSLDSLQERLGHQFNDVTLLRLALTHPSAALDSAGTVEHNQRLEYLGDAVLQLVLTHELYARFPRFGEGPLTKARAHLVNRRTLARHGAHLELGGQLVLSRGEETTGGRQRPSALADAFEAVVGAVFLDAGFAAARQFVLRHCAPEFDQVNRLPNLDNPKGDLQEILQAASSEAPAYRVTDSSGPDHDREFECAVSHGGRELGRGRGKSKKDAESAAARAALDLMRTESRPTGAT